MPSHEYQSQRAIPKPRGFAAIAARLHAVNREMEQKARPPVEELPPIVNPQRVPAAGPEHDIERCYTPQQIADRWGFKTSGPITKIFQDEPGVLKFNAPRLSKRTAGKQPHVIIRIPASVLNRVARKLGR